MLGEKTNKSLCDYCQCDGKGEEMAIPTASVIGNIKSIDRGVVVLFLDVRRVALSKREEGDCELRSRFWMDV